MANLGKRVAHAVKDRAGRKVAARRAANLTKILNAKQTLAEGLGVDPKRIKADPHFIEHHLAHIASSYYVSPFDRAAVLSIDGFGDTISAMWGVGEGGKVRIMGEVSFPHSLGVYYTAVTQYLGFHRYGDEYKVMGLASYGDPIYMDEFRRIVHSAGLGLRPEPRRLQAPHRGRGHDLGRRLARPAAAVGSRHGDAPRAGRARARRCRSRSAIRTSPPACRNGWRRSCSAC